MSDIQETDYLLVLQYLIYILTMSEYLQMCVRYSSTMSTYKKAPDY